MLILHVEEDEVSPSAKHDQLKAVANVKTRILQEVGVDIELIINERYQECLQALRKYAAKRSEELKSPVMRLFQIEELLAKHLKRRTNSTLGSNELP